jgi:predicted transcriptional regulator
MDDLKFDKKPKRDSPLTVRLPSAVLEKLKEIAAKYDVNQTDVIEKLIEEAYEKMPSKKRK